MAKKKKNKKLKKLRKYEGKNFRYHGYSHTKRVLNIRKKTYKKAGYKVRSYKTKSPTGYREYLIYVRKGWIIMSKKTRKFGKKVYRKLFLRTNKERAKNRAKLIRERGKLARVVKKKGGYEVYYRNK